jgi:hypothetical protein
VIAFQQKPVMAKAELPKRPAAVALPAVVVDLKPNRAKVSFVAPRVVPQPRPVTRTAVAAAR